MTVLPHTTTATTVVLVGSPGASRHRLVAALEAAPQGPDGTGPCAVTVIDPGVPTPALAEALAADPAGLVHVVGSFEPPCQLPLDELDEADWAARAEAPVWALIETLQAVRRGPDPHLPLVVVVDADGLTGAVGATAETTAAEGARAVAKSAGRAWGAGGPAIHLVATTRAALSGAAPVDGAFRAPSRGEPTVAQAADAIHAAFALPDGIGVTTLVVDGARTMMP